MANETTVNELRGVKLVTGAALAAVVGCTSETPVKSVTCIAAGTAISMARTTESDTRWSNSRSSAMWDTIWTTTLVSVVAGILS